MQSGDRLKADACELPSSINRAVCVVAILACVLRVAVAAYSRFTNEDALISLRYATHIASGMGFAYNPGSRVLGTTTPGFTLLLALFCRLHLPVMAIGKLVNIGADGLLCIVAAKLAFSAVYTVHVETVSHQGAAFNARVSRTAAAGAILACLMVALNPIHIRWSVSGMETSLVALLSAIVWLNYTRAAYYSAYLTAGCLFLIRWDSLLLLAALTAGVVLRTGRVPWRGLCHSALIVVPWLLFSTRYFGSPIPVTAASKMAVYGWRADHAATWMLRTLPQLGRVGQLFWGNIGSALFSIAAIGGAIYCFRYRVSVLLAPVAWFVLYWVAFLASRVLLFGWYVPPVMVVYEVLAAIGIGVLCSAWRPRQVRPLLVACAALAASAASAIGTAVARSCAANQATEGAQNREIGMWLKKHSARGDRVMLEPIGYIGYFSGLQVVDCVGLVTPECARFYVRSSKAPMRDIGLHFKPQWCVVRPGELQHIMDADAGNGRWASEYTLAKRFSMPRPGRDAIVFFVYHRKS